MTPACSRVSPLPRVSDADTALGESTHHQTVQPGPDSRVEQEVVRVDLVCLAGSHCEGRAVHHGRH